MKFEVCAIKTAQPIVIDAHDLEEAYDIAVDLDDTDFKWNELEITDVEWQGD